MGQIATQGESVPVRLWKLIATSDFPGGPHYGPIYARVTRYCVYNTLW